MSIDRDLTSALLRLVRELADQLRPGNDFAQSLGIDHSLERDYGLDSLSRAELLTRIESELGVSLERSRAFAGRDAARPAARHRPPRRPRLRTPSAPEPARDDSRIEYPPATLDTLVDVLDWHAERHGERLLVTIESQHGATTHLTLCKAAHRRARGGCGPGRARLRRRRRGGRDVADRKRVLRGVLRRALRRLRAGAAVSAGAPGAARRPSAAQCRNPAQRRSQAADHGEPGEAFRAAAARALRIAAGNCNRLRPRACRAGRSRALRSTPASTAFLQYTSGSTGNPKGVVLSHANLLANVRAMWRASRVSSADTFVSWLPLYHDMGLIGACIGSLVVGYRLVLMSPLEFLAKPSRWLWAIHRHRGTLSAAPNFAYELCANKMSPTPTSTGLDLGSWRLAFNGAEPVSPDTLERFAARFARYGFRREAMFTVFGLAEGVLGVTFPPLGRGPVIDRRRSRRIDARRLREAGSRRRCERVACRVVRRAAAGTRGARRRCGSARAGRTRAGPGPVPRAVGDPRLLQEPVGQRRAVRRRLVEYRRPRLLRRRRAVPHRPRKGPDHPPRGQHPPGRTRSCGGESARRAQGRRGGLCRCRSRATAASASSCWPKRA